MSREAIFGLAIDLFAVALALVIELTHLEPIIGWPIVGALLTGGTALTIYGFRKKEIEKIKSREGVTFSPRAQAHKELANLIELGQELWEAEGLVREGPDPFEDKKLRKILADIQRERNSAEHARIGDPVLEDLFNALVSLYMRFTEYGFPHDSERLQNLNDDHAKIRRYINHRIKD